MFDGDSITTGFGLAIPPDKPYPVQLIELFGKGSLINKAVGGQTLAQMEVDAATDIDALLGFANGANLVLSWWGGTNDNYTGASAATIISRLDIYYAARKAAGWRQIEVGMLPRSNSGTPAGFEANRQAIRTDRLSKYTIATAETNIWKNADGNFYVDMGADTTMGLAGQETSTTYYLDLVHPTNAGYAIAANYVKKAIQLFP